MDGSTAGGHIPARIAQDLREQLGKAAVPAAARKRSLWHSASNKPLRGSDGRGTEVASPRSRCQPRVLPSHRRRRRKGFLQVPAVSFRHCEEQPEWQACRRGRLLARDGASCGVDRCRLIAEPRRSERPVIRRGEPLEARTFTMVRSA